MFKNRLKWLALAPFIYTMLMSCGRPASTKHTDRQLRPPVIQLRALYPGANVSTILDTVAPQLTDSILRRAENMDSLRYTANSDGSLVITVYFKPGTDPDLAGVNISNLAAVASPHLPAQVVQSGITVVQQNDSLSMAVELYSEDTGTYNQTFLANYVAVNIAPELSRVHGVRRLITFDGNKDSLLRIWLNKGHMDTLRTTLQGVLAVIPAEKQEAVTGILYKHGNPSFDYLIKCKTIHTNNNTFRTLKEVAAKIELGPYTYGHFSGLPGKSGIHILIMQAADSNDNGLQTAVKTLMQTAAKSFPTGIKHSVSYNPKDALYISAE